MFVSPSPLYSGRHYDALRIVAPLKTSEMHGG